MALLRSLPENATLADLRRTYADLLEKLRPYGQRLMRDRSKIADGRYRSACSSLSDLVESDVAPNAARADTVNPLSAVASHRQNS